ncbi:hypothetical protein Tco_0501119, partial [Tanacetum coccineum]
VLLHRHDTSDSAPGMSLDTSASPGYLSVLGRTSLAKVISHVPPLVAQEETIPHHVPIV